MLEVFTFFKRPSLQIGNYFLRENKFLFFFKILLLTFGLAITSLLLLKIVDFVVFYACHFSIFETISKHNNKYFLNNNFWYNCFYTALLAPFIEEVIFRLSLNLKKWNVALGVSMLSFMFIGDKIFKMSIYSFNTWLKFVSVFFILMVFYFIKQKHFDIIKDRYFGFYFYLFSLSFGLMHVFNFVHLIPNTLVLLAVFFVLPQIILGFFAGYIRIKIGFLWGLALHVSFNMPITLLHILTNK